MQRTVLILACFFICVNSFSQQYPFVHYTPKDGLLSNRVRNIYQDSKGHLYFTTQNGLSVYDGARFTNYTSENGLSNDIVNCVMEMGDDSIWVVTNYNKVNYLSRGKVKTLFFKNGTTPVINFLCKNDRGDLFVAADEGLFLFQQDHFIKLPFADLNGKDVNRFISNIIPVGDYLLISRDYGLLIGDDQYVLFLYSIKEKKIIAHTNGTKIFSINKAPDGRIWASTQKSIQAIDTDELKKGNLVLGDLPEIYKKVPGTGIQSLFFDQAGNCWLANGSTMLTKCDLLGNLTDFSTSSGLSSANINSVLQDKEGITWIATNGAGVDKLMRTSFALFEKVFGLSSIINLSYSEKKNELLLYSAREAKALWLDGDKIIKQMKIPRADKISQLIETPYGIFGIGGNKIFHLQQQGDTFYPQLILEDSTSNIFSEALIDNYGNLVIGGKEYLTVIAGGKKIFQHWIGHYIDYISLDQKGNIWIATRGDQLIEFRCNPDNPNYLEKGLMFSKEINGLSPRSIIIDKNDIIWIGTRSKGLFSFKRSGNSLIQQYHFTSKDGLSENFVSYLFADKDNTLWACTPSGLDKISLKNGHHSIENMTRQNNVYQSIGKVIMDKDKRIWALSSVGLIKIGYTTEIASGYIPKLVITQVRSGTDTLSKTNDLSLSYWQNNLNFYFAAPTFLDEKHVLYSYRLQGSSNEEWTIPSISLIDLHPGDYTLNIKANFPAGRYPEQIISYKFSIAPPWWQTWWFRIIIGLLIIGLLIIAIRFYYTRKLEKEKTILEKQQAIEKERTRIATDMHDDLGAGLSRIKFLSETIGIKKQQQQPIEEDISKIMEYSLEMIDKMDEIVWALNEKNDTVADLVAFTRSYVLEYLSGQNIHCELNTPLTLPSSFITGEMRQHVFLSVKECLHNIVKHAGASQVYFSVRLNGGIEIIIQDNGKGLNWDAVRPYSNGIENIRKRMTEIHGKVIFRNEEGTKVTMNIPYEV
jgi:signal transduction histidine kinase/ligand-binding sensor domain-containing protein